MTGKFYTADVVATAARYGAAVSLTTGSNPSVNTAITTIEQDAWTAIHYPNAFVDDETGELVSDAEVAEIPYVAFTSRPKRHQVAGRLIVRRVKRLNPTPGQNGLFQVWRHHAVFLTSPWRVENWRGDIDQAVGHGTIGATRFPVRSFISAAMA